MRVATTESYLQDKMHRPRQRLSDDYGADPKQLDVITEYLTADKKKGLTAYASQLHKEWNTLGDRATQLVSYVQVPHDVLRERRAAGRLDQFNVPKYRS